MRYEEYGSADAPVILLLHGGGLGPWNYHREAELLKDRFRVVLPVLDGHNGSDRDFTSMEDAAAALIEWIDAQFGGQVLLLGGLSLGGQILVEALSQRSNLCRYALIESALTLPMPLTAALLRPSVALSWPLVKKRWFAKAQFRSLHIDPVFFEEYFRDSAAVTRENMTAFLAANSRYSLKPGFAQCEARTLILAGGRESSVMQRSAELLHRTLPGSALEVLPGLRHGELSLNRPEAYAEKLLRLVSGKTDT